MNTQMQQVVAGRFANAQGQQGNFTANCGTFTFFIHKNLMNQLGFTKDEDIQFPFYAVLQERDIFPRDANGELSTVAVKRLQAVSIFKTEEEMLNAINASDKLKIKAKLDLQKFASTAGLDTQTINALLSASV